MSYPRYFVEPEQPPRYPSLYQVVRGPQRSIPMALPAAKREAERLNALCYERDEEEGPWGGEWGEPRD